MTEDFTVFVSPSREGKHAKGIRKEESARNMQRVAPDLSRAPVLENAITDFRESFDVILASDDLPPSLPAGLACQQVETVVDHLTNAIPVILPLVAEPEFVSTGFLVEIDSLLRDLQDVAAIADACITPLPPPLEPTLINLKINYLDTFTELLD